MPVVIGMTMAPLPVVFLFFLVGLCELVILLVVLLEVSPVRLIFSAIPFVKIFVSFVFVALVMLVGLMAVALIAFLRADGDRNNQAYAEQNHLHVTMHGYPPGTTEQDDYHCAE